MQYQICLVAQTFSGVRVRWHFGRSFQNQAMLQEQLRTQNMEQDGTGTGISIRQMTREELPSRISG